MQPTAKSAATDIIVRNNSFEFYNFIKGITKKTCIIYKEEDRWYVGHIQEYPDYESQDTTLEELKENLLNNNYYGIVVKNEV